jgi:hypothetical protein
MRRLELVMTINKKKLKAIVTLNVLLVSQIACGSKVLTTPLNRAQFDSNYTYDIHAVQNTKLPNISGSNIQNFGDRIHITQNNQTKYLLHNQIQSIDGESIQNVGTNALKGMGIGAAVGGTLGLGVMGLALSTPSDSDDFCEGSQECNLYIGSFIGLGLTTLGGLIGLGVGSMTPAKQKVQITPYISPTAQGVSGGANIGMKF